MLGSHGEDVAEPLRGVLEDVTCTCFASSGGRNPPPQSSNAFPRRSVKFWKGPIARDDFIRLAMPEIVSVPECQLTKLPSQFEGFVGF